MLQMEHGEPRFLNLVNCLEHYLIRKWGMRKEGGSVGGASQFSQGETPKWNPTGVLCSLVEEGQKWCPQELPPVSRVLCSSIEGFSPVQFNCVHQSTLLGQASQGHKHCHPFLNVIVLFGMPECCLRPSSF